MYSRLVTRLIKRTYGSRTYPVGYGCDAQQRMIKMTNWTAFSSAGERVTTWNHNAYRGWLDNKRYADGNGPDYTYTPGGRLKTRAWARTAPAVHALSPLIVMASMMAFLAKGSNPNFTLDSTLRRAAKLERAKKWKIMV